MAPSLQPPKKPSGLKALTPVQYANAEQQVTNTNHHTKSERPSKEVSREASPISVTLDGQFEQSEHQKLESMQEKRQGFLTTKDVTVQQKIKKRNLDLSNSTLSEF
jgi:hypothetical protein